MGGMRVLLVDDEPELVHTMAERLEIRDFEVDAVTSGAAALEKIKSEAYDVVVIDLKMPGMSGHAVMTAVRVEHPRLPIILLTGHGAAEDDEENADLDQACAYLFKPINIDELIRTMRECVKVDE
jgi:DNA-binding response OmpR family regulator